ncbi:MAG: hypothetical protein OXG40_11820 [Acidimicrobiaceae bacterium]|nr:hypothetical protein [Acidimicrobiaceae bacterium]
MSMTQTLSTSSSFTKTSARHVASKVAADLYLVQLAYGQPTNAWITDYEAELVELLAGRFVESVTYGFKQAGLWIPPSLKYQARLDGTLTSDDRAGKIPRGCDVSGASFTSFLRYTAAWSNLTPAEKASVKAALPFQRTYGQEPATKSGIWGSDKLYAHNGGGVNRSALRPTG